MKKLQTLVSAALCAAMVGTAAVPAWAADAGQELKFNAEGKLKVMILADTQDDNKPSKNMLNFVNAALDQEKPDLVVFLGDQVQGYSSAFKHGDVEKAVQETIDAVVDPVEKRGIPFAVVFGNHDSEALPKEKQMAMYQKHKGCLAVDEGEALSGCGTYNIPIKSKDGSRTAYNFYFIDSHENNPNEDVGGYAYVNQDQIDWCTQTSATLKAQNGGKAVPSMLFQHIIVPEVYDMLKKVPKGTEGAVRGHRTFGENNQYYALDPATTKSGKLLEGPCPPDENSGQFAAMKAQGDIVAAWFAHDHVNSFIGTYQGIDLGASPGCTFADYGDKDTRGIRVLELDETKPQTYETHVVDYWELMGNNLKTQMDYYLYTDRAFPLWAKITIPTVLGLAIIGAAVGIGVSIHKKKKKMG